MSRYIQVFIENEAGKNIKNYYDEKTLQYIRSTKVSKKYPYPYGFLLNTTNHDGDNLDCFIITNRNLLKDQIITCIPIGILEQFEDNIEDNNILAILPEEIDIFKTNKKVLKKVTDFILHVFENIPGKLISVGNYYGKKEALKYINNCLDYNLKN